MKHNAPSTTVGRENTSIVALKKCILKIRSVFTDMVRKGIEFIPVIFLV